MKAGAASSFNSILEPGIVTRSVSEGEAAIGHIPRLRFGLLSQLPTPIAKLYRAPVPRLW